MSDLSATLLGELLDELNIRPLIHAGGTKSSMGGAKVDTDTADVMRESLDLFFDMDQLLVAVGKGTARVLEVEGAAVVAGAASGCVLAAAALREERSPAGPAHLITQRRHYGRYTYLYEQGGCQVVEVGTMNDCPLQWYAEAIDEHTVGIAWLEGPGIRSAGVRLEEVCELAASHRLPVLVDAAAQAYPFGSVRAYFEAGADLVVISGGKLLRGPQASGFVLGSDPFVRRIRELGFPRQGVARAHKITKEVALGAYAAIRRFANDPDGGYADVAARADRMAEQLVAVGVPAQVEYSSRYLVPAVVVYAVHEQHGVRPSAVSRRELADVVPIFFAHDDATDELYVQFASLDAHHDDLVRNRLVAALAASAAG